MVFQKVSAKAQLCKSVVSDVTKGSGFSLIPLPEQAALS